MNEMLTLLTTGDSNDSTIFLALFLRRLPASMRDHLAAVNLMMASNMARHTDILWDSTSGELAIPAVTDGPVSSPCHN
jgi:hypothetical protein